jgi:hypothetical protein
MDRLNVVGNVRDGYWNKCPEVFGSDGTCVHALRSSAMIVAECGMKRPGPSGFQFVCVCESAEVQHGAYADCTTLLEEQANSGRIDDLFGTQ